MDFIQETCPHPASLCSNASRPISRPEMGYPSIFLTKKLHILDSAYSRTYKFGCCSVPQMMHDIELASFWFFLLSPFPGVNPCSRPDGGGVARLPHPAPALRCDEDFAEDPNTSVLLDLLYHKFLPQLRQPELVVDFPKVCCGRRPGPHFKACPPLVRVGSESLAERARRALSGRECRECSRGGQPTNC